jgi:hypothetical protein
MKVSLDQAIEIHAKALRHRHGTRAPLLAREKAHHCNASGDHEGHTVWQRVAAMAEAFPTPRPHGGGAVRHTIAPSR